MKEKKGQLAIGVIIAVILVLGIVLYFVFRDKSQIKGIPLELVPVFEYYSACIESEISAGADLAGSQAGHLETGAYEPGSDYAPFSSQLNFLGFGVPYWYYISGNGIVREQVPSKAEIEEQMERFVETRLKGCDFEEFAKRGFRVEAGEPDVEINIEDDKIMGRVSAELSVSKGESVARKNSYSVEVKSSLGKMYNLAKEIYNKEKNEAFLEKYAEDVLRSYAPVDGVEISCGPKIWKSREVKEEIKRGLEGNIANVKFKGRYYELNDNNKYFVVDKDVDMPVNLMYNRNWPTKIEISGADGELLVAEPIGNQAGLGILGFCYAPYHYVYDLSFPVLIQIYNEQGELFQYPVAVIIDNNVPRKADLEPLYEEEELKLDICGFKTQEIEVNVYDNNLGKIDANLSYQCFDQTCRLGETKGGQFKGMAPACLNGRLIADSGGYGRKKLLFSTNEGEIAELIIDREYEVELSVEIDGKLISGNALINFIGENSVSTVVPDESKIKLSEGRYNLTVSVYGNSSIIIPGSTKRECTEVTRGGLAGFFGGTQEKCFDINIPETKIDYALVGGGKAEIYLLPEMLEKGKLKIVVDGFPKPDSLERLQYNYALLENSGLEVGG